MIPSTQASMIREIVLTLTLLTIHLLILPTFIWDLSMVFTLHAWLLLQELVTYKDFEIRHNGLCCRLMQQSFTHQKLCKQLNKTLKNHTTLFNKYEARIEVPLAIMANTGCLKMFVTTLTGTYCFSQRSIHWSFCIIKA